MNKTAQQRQASYLSEGMGMDMASLTKKWDFILDLKEAAPIKDSLRRHVTAVMLENTCRNVAQNRHLQEASVSHNLGGPFAGSKTGNDARDIQGYDPLLISMVRRAMPQLIAYDVCGVQPMTGPTGLIFSLRAHYETGNPVTGTSAGTEALFQLVDSDYAGAKETVTVFNGDIDGAAAGDKIAGDSHAALKGLLASVGLTSLSNAAAQAAVFTSAADLTAATANAVISEFNDAADGFMALELRGTIDVALVKSAGMATSAGEYGTDVESGNFNSMGFSIDTLNVTSKTRQLKADYSRELQKDLQNVHGIDAQKELSNILAGELLGEINREVLENIYISSEVGAQKGTSTKGVVDINSADVDGRWIEEKYKALYLYIEQDLHMIAKRTRRGKGNILLCSTDVATALNAGNFLNSNVVGPASPMDIDETQNTFVGMLNNQTKVFVDPYIGGVTNEDAFDFYVAGYRGSSAFDAGLFYCPYVPFEMLTAVHENNFQPTMGITTRFGIAGNPLAQAGAYNRETAATRDSALLRNSNRYYRKVAVKSILS